MSLNFELTKIENWEKLCYIKVVDKDDGKTYERINPVTEAIIFMTMAVGIGEITAKTWEEFALRAHMFGFLDHGLGAKVMAADIRAHIGLRCNVSSTSKAKFAKALEDSMRRAAQRVLFPRTSDHEARPVAAMVTAMTVAPEVAGS